MFERLSRVYTLVLTAISDEQYFVLWTDLFEKFPHLFRRCQGRFIDQIEMPGGSISRLSVTACEETLQRIGRYAGVAELLRRAGGRCEALDLIAVPFSALPHHGQGRGFSNSGTTMQSLHLVARGEDVFDGISLGSIEVGPGLG